jgi:hypothetical protein
MVFMGGLGYTIALPDGSRHRYSLYKKNLIILQRACSGNSINCYNFIENKYKINIQLVPLGHCFLAGKLFFLLLVCFLSLSAFEIDVVVEAILKLNH